MVSIEDPKMSNHDYNFVDIDQMTEAPITDIQY